MLQLFAVGTGQGSKFPQSLTTAHAGSISQQNGSLSQDVSYKYGQAYSFQSNLPVAGGYQTQQYGGSQSVTLNVNGQSAADLLEGRVANTVTPSYIQNGYSAALQGSNGRISNSATIQQPGLITS